MWPARLLMLIALLGGSIDAQQAPFPLHIRGTQLLRRGPAGPAAVVALDLQRPLQSPAHLLVRDGAGATLFEGPIEDNRAGATIVLDVPFAAGTDHATLHLTVDESNRPRKRTVRIARPADDWVMHFIPGFHYDPVWWNTQAHYTETGYRMGAAVGPGLTLVDEYLRKCFEDPDYTVALHQLPYLKTFLEARPQRFGELLSRIREGRCAIVGGSYNEMSSTLISAESTARNAIYGTLFQRDILGGDGRVWWQCDVFGHDPSFPSLMAAAGHTAGAFARGPFHQWGAPREQVNFPSEFMWMAPDGRQVLTHYMTGHYGYAYATLAAGTNRAPEDPARCEQLVATMFEDLRRPALTHHVLLPMHMDFIRPLENLGEVCRLWNAAYVSPQARMSTPAAFFDALRREIERRRIVVPVITRDMNPVYTGCAVSFADLKTAQRSGEVALREAEIFATLATLEGADYPGAALDRAWRQLMFNAHHDAVTGSMSDQVYLDVLYIYRDALEIARGVRDAALQFLAARYAAPGTPQTLVWNSLAHPRTVHVPCVAEPVALPALGLRAVSPAPQPADARRPERHVLENDHLQVVIDPQRGATIRSLIDKHSGRELLHGPGNALVVLDEYESLPGHGEGPWHLAPTGGRFEGTDLAAVPQVMDLARPHALTYRVQYPQFTRRVTYELLPGSRTLDMETRILGWTGSNRLLRVEFPARLPGARPVFQTAAAVIGRPFARDVDAASDPWTLDQACWQWAGLGVVCALEVYDGNELIHRRALGVAEIVIEQGASADGVRRANRLARALVQRGVTSTVTRAHQRRYGDLTHDSNVPDFRVALGAAPELLAALGLAGPLPQGAAHPTWIEGGDGLPVLVVPTFMAMRNVLLSLASGPVIRIDAARARVSSRALAPDYTVALINRGTVSVHVEPDGTLGLNLLRACTGWPAGVWIDPPRRRLPDGSAFETMHGSHAFRYSLFVGPGDHRTAGVSRVSQQINHPAILSRPQAPGPGAPPASAPPPDGLVSIAHPDVLLAALKPAGFPEARWMIPTSDGAAEPPGRVMVRLWNSSDRAVSTSLRLHRFADRAWRSNLLEETLEPLPVESGAVQVQLGPFAYDTLLLAVDPRAGRADRPAAAVAPQPSAYWLENRGEGVTGNGILALAPARRELRLSDGAARVAVRVVNNHQSATVSVALHAVTGPALQTRWSRDTLDIAPRSFAEVQLAIRRQGSAIGSAFVTLEATSDYPWSVSGGVWVVDRDGGPGPAAVEIVNAAAITPTQGGLEARVYNHTAGPLRGEAAWLSPQFLWEALPGWREPLTVPAGGSVKLAAPLAATADSWALLRFTAAGRVFYGEPVAVVGDARAVFLTSELDRLRLRRGQPTELTITARSLQGLHADTSIQLHAPEAWGVEALGQTLTRTTPDCELQARFRLRPEGPEDASTLQVSGPAGSSATLRCTVVPVQRARPDGAAVGVDGDLSEWAAEEFTRAQNDFGTVRCAVRHGPAGLALAFEVRDALFSQDYRGGAMWQGDSVQFGLSAVPSTTIGYQDNDYEYGAALTPDGPMAWCWIAGRGVRTGRVQEARVAVEVEGDRACYEILLPREILPLPDLRPGAVLGFTYLANDNDGAGFRGAVQWTRGISGGKDPSLFGDLLLLE